MLPHENGHNFIVLGAMMDMLDSDDESHAYGIVVLSCVAPGPFDSPWIIRLAGDPEAHPSAFARDLQRLAFVGPKSSAEDQPRYETFALMDAARFPGLAETLETSDLENASLFRGGALEELADVAPWLVRLEPEHRLTRHLLTPRDPNGPHWKRWGDGAAVLIRSDASFDALLRHFRRYTRIYDKDAGKWNYFRFYAPETLRGMIAHMPADTFADFVGPVQMFIVEDHDRQIVLITATPSRIEAFLTEAECAC